MKPEIIYLLIGTGGSITPYGNIKTLLESLDEMRFYKLVRKDLHKDGEAYLVSNGERYKILTTTVMRAPYKKV